MIGFNLGPVGEAVREVRIPSAPAGPSWTFVSAGPVTTITSGTSLVLPLGTTAQAGDFIVVQISGSASLVAPQGAAVDSGTQLARYIQAVGGETSLTFTIAVAGQVTTGIAVVFRPTSAGARVTSQSIVGNPAVVDSLAVSNLPGLITFTGNRSGTTSVPWTVISQPGFVEVANVTPSGTVRALYFAYKIQTSGATTGSVSLAAPPINVRATVGVFRLT